MFILLDSVGRNLPLPPHGDNGQVFDLIKKNLSAEVIREAQKEIAKTTDEKTVDQTNTNKAAQAKQTPPPPGILGVIGQAAKNLLQAQINLDNKIIQEALKLFTSDPDAFSTTAKQSMAAVSAMSSDSRFHYLTHVAALQILDSFEDSSKRLKLNKNDMNILGKLAEALSKGINALSIQALMKDPQLIEYINNPANLKKLIATIQLTVDHIMNRTRELVNNSNSKNQKMVEAALEIANRMVNLVEKPLREYQLTLESNKIKGIGGELDRLA